MQSETASMWLTVARDDEFRQALAALDDNGEFRGVALTGARGVGKSTLAGRLAETIEASGRTVRFGLGTETEYDEILTQQADLVVVVDDAHLLDSASASLAYRLAASHSARLIVTICSGEAVRDPVSALLNERLLLSLHIQPFSREQTGQLASQTLGGPADAHLVDELYDRSGGNALLLCGLLNAGRENGVLVQTEGRWQLRGPLRADRELYNLLDSQLESLAPKELEAIEILATAELRDWEVLRVLCESEALNRLRDRGLIQLTDDGPDTVVRLNHPVLGDAALRRAGVARSRQLNGQLAQALQKHLRSKRRDRRIPDLRGQIRLAQYMMRSDAEPDLAAIVTAAASATTMSNHGYAEELARFAYDCGAGLPAAIVLAESLSWQGAGEEAEEVLSAFNPNGDDERMTMRWGCLRAANLFWVCRRVGPARQVLTDLRARIGSELGAAMVNAIQLSFAFFSGDAAGTSEMGPHLCATSALPLATVWTAVPTACALTFGGRFGEAKRIIDVGLQAATSGEAGAQRFALGMVEVMTLTAAGDHPAAEQAAQRYARMAAGTPAAEAMVAAIFGLVHLAGGALQYASSAFDDSISTLSQGVPPPWTMLVAAWHAQAEGARGNRAAAAAALQSAEAAYGPQVAVFAPELEIARAWERASAGETAAAQHHSVCAAQIARNAGMHVIEMRALHTAVRLGDGSHAARLGELAEILGTALAQTVADHARGLAGHDPDVLNAAAERFAELGALALAADAAAEAAREHARIGHRGKELESSTRAYWLASQSESRTPAVNAAAQPLPISDREYQVALLVAAGLSNRQIADKLSVSVRTVEGHLYRIFTKLDIKRRDQLARLISAGRTP